MTDSSLTEKWLPVVGYEGLYEVSDFGRVKSISRTVRHPQGGVKVIRERILRTARRKYGHLAINLHGRGKKKVKFVHRLVLESFIGPCPTDMQCCHNDSDASNNYLDNLRWDTCAANHEDMVKHGSSTRGERNRMSKLSRHGVIGIRKLCDDGLLPQWKIAEMYGVAQSSISMIHNRVAWAWLESV